MANKRNNRKKVKKFYCPLCENRLWRLGTTKYYFYYKNDTEIRKNTGLSTKKAKLLINQNITYLDTNRWIEGFHCSNDGNIWLNIAVQSDDYQYRLAKREDWLQTNKTLDPEVSNPSVSEFTIRMSRKLRYTR